MHSTLIPVPDIIALSLNAGLSSDIRCVAFKSLADVSDDTELERTPRDTASCTTDLCLRDDVGDVARPVGYALGPVTARCASSGMIDG